MSTWIDPSIAKQLADRGRRGHRPGRLSLIAFAAASFALGLIIGRFLR